MKILSHLAMLMVLYACSASAELTYKAEFHAEFFPETGFANARLSIGQSKGQLRQLDFSAPDSQFSKFKGDGSVKRSGERLIWKVPKKGGELTYRVRIDHKRRGAYDARMTEDWALLRLGDLFPAANARSRGGAVSMSTLTLAGPEGWSFETRYDRAGYREPVRDDSRSFDRPTGWMVAGKIGVRRDSIGGRSVAVAAPAGQSFHRLDVLAFLRWNLPTLLEIFPGFPESLIVVGAPMDMWRGGLSGPGSLYLHAARPLLSENATSPLLHELVHVATARPPADGDDWIAEGLAEYYGLEILRRTGTISEARFTRAMSWLQGWSDRENGRLSDPSTGPNTARAVLLFRDLNSELQAADSSLDAVVGELYAKPEPDRNRLRKRVRELLGKNSPALDAALASSAGQEQASKD